MLRIASSARRHGIADEDMLHALRNAIGTENLGDGFTMLIGPAQDARLVEIDVADSEDGPVIVDAIKARPKYFRRRGDGRAAYN